MQRTTLAVLLLYCACTPRAAESSSGALPPIPPLRQGVSTAREPACDAAQRIVASVREPLHIEAYVTTGTPERDAFAAQLGELLGRYQRESGGKISVETLDPSDASVRERAVKHGIAVATEEHEGERPLISGLLLRYGANEDSIKQLLPSSGRTLELVVARRIRELVERTHDTKLQLGVLFGHGEIGLTEANLIPNSGTMLVGILKQYFPQLEPVGVDLAKGPIDPSLPALLVTQPARPLSEAELRQIDAFVMQGKTLVVAASAVNIAAGDATMNATITGHGLEKLLAGYGIEQRPDVVVDFARSFQVSVMGSSGLSQLRIPALVDVRSGERPNESLDGSFLGFSGLESVAFPFASSLVLHQDAQPGARFRVLARSSARAQRMTGATVDLAVARHWTVKGELAQQTLAASVEGPLKSAFGTDRARKPARVLVLSSSQIFANPLTRAGAPPPTVHKTMLPVSGDEMLQQLAMPYAQNVLTNTILLAKQTLLDWAVHEDDLHCLAPTEGRR
jgi:ABC-type uncharacterized transport system involved in gliding motility auxiliary subunit